MISRHWTGLAKREEAENYINHLRTDTLPQLSKLQGFLKASILRRSLEEGVEFLIVTDWDSIDAIKQFAGKSEEVAVVPEVVQSMMIRYDAMVRHYELAASYAG